MKSIVKALNDAFIAVVLSVLYIVGIGFSFLLQSLFVRKKKGKSYWKEVERKGRLENFQSPY